MTLSTTQIENQAETHRAHISDLIDELRTRVTPGEVIDEFLGWDEGHEIARNFGRQVKNNPLPLALIGTGVAWLMLSDTLQRRNGTYSTTSRYAPKSEGITDSLSEGISRAGDSVSDATDYARSAASGVGASVRETASQIGDTTASAVEYGRQKVSDLAGSAQSAYAKTKETVNQASDSVTETATSAWQKTTQFTHTAADTITGIGTRAQEQPLLSAGLGFALGMALGAIFPATEAENSLLGEQSDAVKRKAGELAGEGYEKAKTVAQKSYEAATQAANDEAQNQGLTSDQPTSSQQSSETGENSQSNRGEPSYRGNNGGDFASSTFPHH